MKEDNSSRKYVMGNISREVISSTQYRVSPFNGDLTQQFWL